LQARDSAAFLLEHSRALELLRQSLATHPTADAHLNLGNVHAVADRLDSAIVSYHRAEALYDVQGYRVHRALALGNIGVLSLRLNRLDEAADALRRSIGILEELRGNISSIDIRSSFISNKFYIYENLIGILIQQGRVDEAFEYVERAKARSFLDMIGNKAVGEGKKRDEATSALIQRERMLQRRIEAVLGNADSARVLGEAIGEHQRVIAALRERDPEYASVKSIEPLALAELRRMLDERTAVVEYFVGERSAYGFAVTRDTIVVRRMQVDRGNALEREIEALRRMLYVDFPNTKFSVLREKRMKDRLSPREALAAWRATPVPSTWQYNLVTMYSRFLAPFAGIIEDKEVLYIVPHGPLHHLPFQALIRPADIDTRADAHIARPRYLIERHAIALLPSASVLPFALRRELAADSSWAIRCTPIRNTGASRWRRR
jgi:tetratricopeptide (TPR) repeat protein